jgi:hypothetical protein
MLKIAPLALGLLTVLSIIPSAQAYPVQQPHNQSQFSITIGGQQPIYQNRSGYSRYNYRIAELRRLELQRQRQRELAAERRYRQSRHNNGYYSNDQYNRSEVYNAGIYRAPVNDRGGYNNQDHHNH